MAKKLIIQVCPIGSGGTLHEDTPDIPRDGKRTPYLPITPSQVAEEAKRSYDAVAMLVHIHARDSKTMMPTPDIKVWGEIVSEIRAKCPMVIEAGGGIGPWVKDYKTLEIVQPDTAQKLALLDVKPEPDMLTVNVGTFDFSVGHAPRHSPMTTITRRPPSKVSRKRGGDWKLRFTMSATCTISIVTLRKERSARTTISTSIMQWA